MPILVYPLRKRFAITYNSDGRTARVRQFVDGRCNFVSVDLSIEEAERKCKEMNDLPGGSARELVGK